MTRIEQLTAKLMEVRTTHPELYEEFVAKSGEFVRTAAVIGDTTKGLGTALENWLEAAFERFHIEIPE